jgi:flavin reductase (DIM6/NTAB) family NADH-FMN oxidoreductase RutF
MMADGGLMQGIDFVPGAETARQFRDALGTFTTGVTLVTIDSPQGPMGFAANSFASVSLDPPLVLWSMARSARRFPPYMAAQHYAIHVLPVSARAWLARFASAGSGFDGLPHARNPEGVPVLDAVLARFDCRQHMIHDGGDHAIILGEVLRAVHLGGEALVFSQGQYGGFSPSG